jgi:hypothetical protein
MFECNDNNLLLILGIGIIVLILLKLMYSNNNNSQKHYKNLNCRNNYERNNENKYEDFGTDTYYKKDYNPSTEHQPNPVQKTIENFEQSTQPVQPAQPAQPAQQPEQKQISISVPIVNDEIFNPNNIEFDYGDASNVNYTLNVNDNPMDMKTKQDKLSSSDLLPGKSDQKWFENPDVGIKIEDANLLSDAVQKVGVDTVGQTRKNPSYDIRGTVPCPKFQISPWNNSTTEPDYNLKSLY